MENYQIYPTDQGTPQSGIISPVLANMALYGLEKRLKTSFPKESKVHIIFYADDFVITGISKELLENEVMPIVKEHVGQRGLELSEEKTLITHISKGFDFLGQNVRKYNDKLLIKPVKKNVKRFINDIRTVIRENQHIHPMYLIWKLNPKIRGWANFHIKWRIHGGVDLDENLVLLHPNCHKQVHSLKLTVKKPGLTKDLRKA